MRHDRDYAQPPFAPAGGIPHEFGGGNGFLDTSYPVYGQPLYSSSLLAEASPDGVNQGALHMIPTTPSRIDNQPFVRGLSVGQPQPTIQSLPHGLQDPMGGHRAPWLTEPSIHLNLLESQVIEAPHPMQSTPGSFLLQGQLKDCVQAHNTSDYTWLPMLPVESSKNLEQDDLHAHAAEKRYQQSSATQRTKPSNGALPQVLPEKRSQKPSRAHPPLPPRRKRLRHVDVIEEYWQRPRAGASRSESRVDVNQSKDSAIRPLVLKPPARSSRLAQHRSRSTSPLQDDSPGREARSEGRALRNKSSTYRGVTKHRRSGRYEAHLWIKELHRQVYLGGYEHEEHAAEAYDVAALKSKGMQVKTNFDIGRYADLTACMDSISLEELIMAVRRQSQGFSRGSSSFRGVTHHPSGRWEARIGIPGSKHIYLGLHNDEDSAARAYDSALVRLRGVVAATNFSLSEYRVELADYHRKQQALLEGSEIEKSIEGSEFEEWIKNGYKNAATESLTIELPNQPDSSVKEGAGDEQPEAAGEPGGSKKTALALNIVPVAPRVDEEKESRPAL